MSKLKTYLCLLFSLSTLLIMAQETQIKFEKYTLKNGLTVILHQDKTVPVVAVSAMYHVGSKNEDTSRTGFAHFFEHLLFEGSKYIKRGEFDKYVHNNGGELNANTTQDRTYYYELLPSNKVDLGLWLESERMLEANILDEGVKTQKEVVKEERRQRLDNTPYGSIFEQTFKRAFKESPYRWMAIGSFEHLSQAQLDEFIAFYKKFYVPDNCVLSIAGDFDLDYLKSKIEQFFGDIPRGKTPVVQPNIIEPPLGGEVRDVIQDNIQLPLVLMAYRVPSLKSPDYFAFKILSTILAGGESSRLNKILVEKKQEALAVGSFPYILENDGLFITYGIANFGKKPEDLEQLMDSVSEELTTQLISEKEFNKVKNQIQTEVISSKRTMAGIAEELANNEVFFGDANLINTELSKYQAVTREDVIRLAKQYLRKDNRVILYYVPKKKSSSN